VSFLAWTTTPWTLPSNLALAVGKDLDYVELQTNEGQSYILAEALVANFFKENSYHLVKTMKGSELLGLEYEPLFPYFYPRENSFKVIESSHVTIESGTG